MTANYQDEKTSQRCKLRQHLDWQICFCGCHDYMKNGVLTFWSRRNGRVYGKIQPIYMQYVVMFTIFQQVCFKNSLSRQSQKICRRRLKWLSETMNHLRLRLCQSRFLVWNVRVTRIFAADSAVHTLRGKPWPRSVFRFCVTDFSALSFASGYHDQIRLICANRILLARDQQRQQVSPEHVRI